MPTRSSRRTFLRALTGGAAVCLAGCSGSPRRTASTPSLASGFDVSTLATASQFGYVHGQPTGNRVLAGAGDLRDADPVDVPVAGTPAWIVGIDRPTGPGSHWTIVTADGVVHEGTVGPNGPEGFGAGGELPPGMPPLVGVVDGRVGVGRPPADLAAFTHPVPVGGAAVTDGGRPGLAYVASTGELVIRRAGGRGAQPRTVTAETASDGTVAPTGTGTRVGLDALPDGRLVRVTRDRYAVLGDRTDRYRHGALGDVLEGGSLVVVDTSTDPPGVVTRRRIDPPAVIEGVKPIVADVTGSGTPDLLVTTARSDTGARIAAFDPSGRQVAVGEPIGSGGWRHQLAVAGFGPDAEREVAAVRKPHVEHRLEFLRYREGRLRAVATLDGFRTHTYGSHNPDGAIAGDLDGDGRVELLAPRTDRRRLHAVRRVEGGAEVAWGLPLDGQLASNVAGLTLGDDRVAVAAGWTDTVRIWRG